MKIMIGIKILFVSIATIIIICWGIILIMSPGKIKQFTDENGKKMKNSIGEKCFVEINGVKTGMIIKRKDISNPVLLFVHGGPGMPEYFLTEDYPTDLEDYYTVVYWDQRGAGLSYGPFMGNLFWDSSRGKGTTTLSCVYGGCPGYQSEGV